ncbi:MAG: restriction endonuclease subunit S [Planctomycetota bacterium]
MRPTLPESWKWCHLDDVATVQTGLALGRKDLKDAVERPYLRVANVQDGYFDLREVKTVRVERSKVARHSLRYGDVLLTEGGDFDKLGRGHIWRDEVAECLHQNHVFAVRPDDSVLLPEYLAAITSGPWGRAYFLGCSKQSTNLASINSTQVKEMPLPLPPLDEQSQIVDRLTQFDEASTCLEELTEHRRQYLRGLMQQLLTGRRRLPAFAGEAWDEDHLGDLFGERAETGRADLPLLSITAERGVIPREEIERKDTSNADKSKYKRIAPGDIGYNTMRMWQGVSALSSLEGIVSPAYTICIPGPKVDGRFARWFFKFPRVVNLFYRYSQGLVDDTLNLKYPHFAEIKVSVPTLLDEQRAIADILDTAQREIELREQLREQIQLQKRGLMQKLLTGEIRVPADEPVTEEVST